MNAKKAEEHIVALAAREGILINWRKRQWHKFECHPNTKQVFVGKPTSPIRYLSGLHEIGHIASEHARAAGDREHILIEEAAAWEWAFEHALDGIIELLTPYHRERIADGWATYLPGR